MSDRQAATRRTVRLVSASVIGATAAGAAAAVVYAAGQDHQPATASSPAATAPASPVDTVPAEGSTSSDNGAYPAQEDQAYGSDDPYTSAPYGGGSSQSGSLSSGARSP